MLAALAEWGIEPALQRMNGMFASGLWDKETRSSRWRVTVQGRSRSTMAGAETYSCSDRNSKRSAPTRISTMKSIVTRWGCLSSTLGFLRRNWYIQEDPANCPQGPS